MSRCLKGWFALAACVAVAFLILSVQPVSSQAQTEQHALYVPPPDTAYDGTKLPLDHSAFSAYGAIGEAQPTAPEWGRDQRYNAWVSSLSAEEQDMLGRIAYGALWDEMEAYFGDVEQPPPPVAVFPDWAFQSGVLGRVAWDERGLRQVQVPETTARGLALKGIEGLNDKVIMLHEWRHLFENASLYFLQRELPHDDQPLEQDANAFSVEAFRVIEKNQQRRKEGKPNLKPFVYDPDDISENIGKNPTDIAYPSF